MPEIKYYTVTQEREVKVSANSPADAVRVADAAFKGEDHDFRDIGGAVQTPIRDRDIHAREDY